MMRGVCGTARYCQMLFKCAMDPGADIRCEVCSSLCQLTGQCPDILLPDMPSVVNYMLT